MNRQEYKNPTVNGAEAPESVETQIARIVGLGDRIAALCDRIEARLDAIDRTNAATGRTLHLAALADGSEGNGWDDIDTAGGGL